VQVTRSHRLEDGWLPWKPVQIRGLEPQNVDVYFFAVGHNPVHAGSLLAIFPLTQPPHACVAAAVSLDGIHFSRPVHLLSSRFSMRTSKSGGQGEYEWRSEDMPAAGVVQSPKDGAHVLLYIHHAVKGTIFARMQLVTCAFTICRGSCSSTLLWQRSATCRVEIHFFQPRRPDQHRRPRPSRRC
jgi:hypothetical protein